MEYMYCFNNASYTSHELPRHEKICFRGLRPGRYLLFRIYTISESKRPFIWSARFVRERKLFSGLVLSSAIPACIESRWEHDLLQ